MMVSNQIARSIGKFAATLGLASLLGGCNYFSPKIHTEGQMGDRYVVLKTDFFGNRTMEIEGPGNVRTIYQDNWGNKTLDSYRYERIVRDENQKFFTRDTTSLMEYHQQMYIFYLREIGTVTKRQYVSEAIVRN